MAIDPMSAVAAARSTATLATFLKGLFGGLPRGDFQKFQRTIYPFMSDKADTTGKSVYAFWFGDVIRVGPDGQWGSIGVTESIAGAEEVFKLQTEKEGTIYVFRCGAGVDFNQVSQIQNGCSFVKSTARSVFRRVYDDVIDVFNDDEVAPVPDTVEDLDFPVTDSPTGRIPGVFGPVRGAGLGFDTPVFAVVALIALFFILPRLGTE